MIPEDCVPRKVGEAPYGDDPCILFVMFANQLLLGHPSFMQRTGCSLRLREDMQLILREQEGSVLRVERLSLMCESELERIYEADDPSRVLWQARLDLCMVEWRAALWCMRVGHTSA